MSKQPKNQKDQNTQETDSVRADKWLWAARFFKTRSIAKAAIEGGKVHHNNERIKVSKEIRIGMELTIQQGFDRKTVVVKALSNIRGGAPAAQLLYEETEVSIARRELISTQRKLHNLARPEHRPSKKDRRDISRFRQENDAGYAQNWSYHDE
ncbi:RNA-binding protein [Acinetobacter defluvii]|uniref:Heat shock protein 15 n=1 Tax=Acinetobacter defluvii TaxID=1871111 RepID=A0A2S2FDY8_9GAMM|nr:S4 domain-containing protein [Acinetobacter defluvii]AWL29183.1 RNA-binding protein [Acinetobacter defluvii]NNP73549.1 RNA-binding protein [Acinetobacter defluvii]